MYVLIRPQSACAGVIVPKKPRKNEPPKRCISSSHTLAGATIKKGMRLEGKNLFDTQSTLHRRKLIFGAGATVLSAGVTGINLGRSRAIQTSATPREAPELVTVPFPFIPDEHAVQLREEYREARLWHDKTIVVFGADLKDGEPHFQTAEALAAIRRKNPNAEIISGLRTGRNVRTMHSDKNTLLETKRKILSRIRENHGTPTTTLFTAHGGPAGIQLGTYTDNGETVGVYITPDEIADSYAPKYRSMGARLTARRAPDILALVNCGSGNIADEFMTSLQRAEIEQEPQRDLSSFQPTLPITFSASTAEEVSYINQLLFEMTEHDTVGEMYASANRIGGLQYSNPGIRVPDTETGVPVIVGANDASSRFA